MKKLLLTLFIATLVLTGCANNTEEPKPTPTPTATTDTAKVSMKDKTFYIEAKDNVKLDDLIALDDKDSKVEVQGDYDLSKAGTYKVKVVVTDKNGNKTEEEKTIVVDNKINIESLKKEEANKPVEPEVSKDQPKETQKPTDNEVKVEPKPTPTPTPETPKLDTSDWRIALAYSYEGREGSCDSIAYAFLGEIFPEMASSYVEFTPISASEARVGDNVAYSSTTGGVGHQAVYLGNGMALHGNYNGKAKVASVYGLPGLSEPSFNRLSFKAIENTPAPEVNEEDLVSPEDYYKDEASGFTPEMCAVPATQLANGSAALAFWCSDNYDHLIKWDE